MASKKDNKKPKADKANKAPKAVKEKTPVEVLPDPAAAVDEEKEITFEDAINEVRNVIDKKHLVEVATSYGVTLSEDMIASHDAEFLIEEVVKTLCTENSHEYIPPKDDDTSDLDAMIAGE